jgi:hypothetical protein
MEVHIRTDRLISLLSNVLHNTHKPIHLTFIRYVKMPLTYALYVLDSHNSTSSTRLSLRMELNN